MPTQLDYKEARTELFDAYNLWKNSGGSNSHPGWTSHKGNSPSNMNIVDLGTFNRLRRQWFPSKPIGNSFNIDNIEYKSGEKKGIGSSLSGGKGSVHFKTRWNNNFDGGFIWHFKLEQ